MTANTTAPGMQARACMNVLAPRSAGNKLVLRQAGRSLQTNSPLAERGGGNLSARSRLCTQRLPCLSGVHSCRGVGYFRGRIQGVQAVSTASTSTTHYTVPSAPQVPEKPVFKYACPICTDTEFEVTQAGRSPQGSLHCPRCARTFSVGEQFVDLTLTSGMPSRVYQQSFWAGTELFRSPLVSFAYERGWRQGFVWAGFPGADKEFAMAMEYLRPAYGEVLLDMSCGSGLFSRRFAKSEQFTGVIAADYSENMLLQANQFVNQDQALDRSKCTMLRADVGRLPFATGSVAAVHAGAALHCWPNPSAAMAEISRVLQPGGLFVASTFLTLADEVAQIIGEGLTAPLRQLEPASRTYKWWTEMELRDLAAAVGLQDFQRQRQRRFIMFRVRKPEAST